MRPAVDILGIPVQRLTLDRLLDGVVRAAQGGERISVAYANAHVLDAAGRDPGLRRFLTGAELVYADGAGAVLASRLLGDPLPGRMTGADWIWDLTPRLAEAGLSLFLLGGRPGVAEQAAARLQRASPGLRLAGTHHGYFDRQGAENEALLAELAASAADVVLVGMGTPLQERWVAANRRRIDAPVVWVTGALADHVAGVVPRAPRWMREHGLEWLFRFASDPLRLGPRYLAGNARFLGRLAMQRLGLRY